MERDLFALSPATRWLGRRLDLHAELDSTNLRAEALAARGAPAGTVVVADGQTAGRGRLGREFFSPPGRSLYCSVLLRPRLPRERVPLFVFAAALAVADTARAFLPATVGIEIKWPNDVLLEGRKTCGINLPVQLDGNEVASAVLGIGLNVNLAREELPEALREIATSLRIAGGKPLDRVAVAEALLARLEDELDRVAAGETASLLDDWGKYFRMAGDRVRVGGPGVSAELEGIVEGIDAEGALLLRHRGVRHRVLAGDVTLLERGA